MRILFLSAAALCLVLSIITFVLCGIDKSAARHDRWRIPEKRFFLLALCGGAYGLCAGMLCFHHKTRHISFVITACIGILLWTAILFLLSVRAYF